MKNDDVLENMGTKNGYYISHRKETVEYYREDNKESILENMIITRHVDVKKKQKKNRRLLYFGTVIQI